MIIRAAVRDPDGNPVEPYQRVRRLSAGCRSLVRWPGGSVCLPAPLPSRGRHAREGPLTSFVKEPFPCPDWPGGGGV